MLAIQADSGGSAPPSRSRLRPQVAASNTLWVGYSSGKLRVFVLDVNALAKEQVGPGLHARPLGPPFLLVHQPITFHPSLFSVMSLRISFIAEAVVLRAAVLVRAARGCRSVYKSVCGVLCM
jgi:hypothetical protein